MKKVTIATLRNRAKDIYAMASTNEQKLLNKNSKKVAEFQDKLVKQFVGTIPVKDRNNQDVIKKVAQKFQESYNRGVTRFQFIQKWEQAVLGSPQYVTQEIMGDLDKIKGDLSKSEASDIEYRLEWAANKAKNFTLFNKADIYELMNMTNEEWAAIFEMVSEDPYGRGEKNGGSVGQFDYALIKAMSRSGQNPFGAKVLEALRGYSFSEIQEMLSAKNILTSTMYKDLVNNGIDAIDSWFVDIGLLKADGKTVDKKFRSPIRKGIKAIIRTGTPQEGFYK